VAITWTLVMSPTISNMAPFTEPAQLLLRSVKITEARVNQDDDPSKLRRLSLFTPGRSCDHCLSKARVWVAVRYC
jgi:hypothetical protein